MYVERNEIEEQKLKAIVSSVIAESLALNVGESREFNIPNLKAQQRIVTRFGRLRKNSHVNFSTKLTNNGIIITRENNEED